MPPDDAYTMEQQGVTDQALSGGGPDPRMAAPPMDPGAMSALFGDDGSGQEAPVDDGSQGPPTDQAPDQAGGDVDPQKLQDVLSDPAMLSAVAQVLKTLGTGDDTDLVHVSEDEKAMLKQGGGAGTPNPTTGLLQYTKDGPDVTDWYAMHPDARVAHISGTFGGMPPSWDSNWWQRKNTEGGTQGGPVANFSGQDFANANVAVTPSWGTALNMAGIVTGMATGGPFGSLASMAIKSMIGEAINPTLADWFGKDSILANVGSFNTPGPRLSPEEVAAVAAAVPAGPPTLGNIRVAQETALAAMRGGYGGGPGGQPGGVAAGPAGGIGVDEAGHAYGTNIGGAGMSHNLAAVGGSMAAASAMADKARAFAASGYGRAGLGGGGGGGGGGNDGGGRSDGGNRGGGQEGGRHGGAGGSSRSD
jgi:hypothetical protein